MLLVIAVQGVKKQSAVQSEFVILRSNVNSDFCKRIFTLRNSSVALCVSSTMYAIILRDCPDAHHLTNSKSRLFQNKLDGLHIPIVFSTLVPNLVNSDYS